MADVEVVGTPEVVKVIARGPAGTGGGSIPATYTFMTFDSSDWTFPSSVAWSVDQECDFGSLSEDGKVFTFSEDVMFQMALEYAVKSSVAQQVGFGVLGNKISTPGNWLYNSEDDYFYGIGDELVDKTFADLTIWPIISAQAGDTLGIQFFVDTEDPHPEAMSNDYSSWSIVRVG